MSEAAEHLSSLEPPPAVKKSKGSKDGGINLTRVTHTPTDFSGGSVATMECSNSLRDRKASMGNTEQVPSPLFTTSMAPSQSQVLATASRKSSSIAPTMSDRVGPQGSSSRTSTFASRMKVRFGKISFREYTASATSAVIQKKRLLITTCVALIFLLIGASILFLLIVPGEKNRPDGTKTCDSDECLRAFYYLDRAGDLLADPCQDFHRYVCYHWRDNDDLEQMTVSNFYSRLDNNLRFDTAIELNSEPGGLLFARAYRSCHEFLRSSGDVRVAPKVAERLKALVWRFSGESTENTLTEQIVRTSVTEGVDVLFGVDLAVYGHRTYPIITKGKSLGEKLGRQFGSYLSEDIVKSFIQLPNDMVSELVKIDDTVRTTLHGNKPTTELNNVSMLSKLSLDATPPAWSSLFEKYLNLSISETAEVLVTDLSKIHDVVSFLRTVTKKKVLGAYLSLQAVADVLFIFIQKKYFFLENVVVARNCLRVTCLVMSHFCGHVTTQFLGWSIDIKKTIQKLYGDILRQYVRSGSSLWSAAGDWLQITDDLLAGPLVTLPIVPMDVTKAAVTRYETLLKDWPDNYPEVHSSLTAAHKMTSINLPLNYTHRYLIEAYLRGSIVYSDVIPGLLVPTALTTPHMTYSSSVPIELNLGTLGAIMAKALVLASTPAESGNWNASMREKFKHATMCIFNAYSKMVNNTAAEWDETVASTLFAWSLSVQLVLGSLLAIQQRRALMGDSSRMKTAQRTLMRRFCLLSCGSAAQESDEVALAARSRCLLPLVGLSEFAKAFSCPVGTAMNPLISCVSASHPKAVHVS